nr:Phage-related minor tail protein [uncultured Mediterranean phage uvMED]
MASKRKVQIELSAVDKTKAAFTTVTRSLSKVGKFGLGTGAAIGKVGFAAAAAAGAMGAFVKVNSDAIDKLGKTASKLGVNVDLLQKMRFAADQTGIAQNTLDMALQRFIRRVGEAQNGTGEAKAALEELGIVLKNSDGSLRSTEEVLFDVAEGIKNTEDASTRLRLAFKFFDSEGAALVNTLKGGAGGLEEFFQEAEDLGIIIDQDTTAAFEKFSDTTSQLFKQIKTVTQYILAAFLPILQQLAESLSNQLKNVAKLAGGFKQLGIDIAVGMVNNLETAVVAMANFSNATFDLFNAFGWFDGAIVDVEALKQKFENIRTSITEVKKPLEDVNKEIDNTANNTKKLSQPVQAFVSQLMDVEKSMEKLTVSTMKKLEDGIVNSLKNGKLEFKQFADYVIEQLLRIAIQKAIIAPITGKFESFFDSLSFDGGGYTGMGSRSGGVDGKGGFPAILHPNETVIDHTKGQGMSSGATVNFNISTVDAAGFDQLLASRKGLITSIINNAMNNQGKMGVV